MNDHTRRVLNEALDGAVPTSSEAAADLEVIASRTRQPRRSHAALVVAVAAASMLALTLSRGSPPPVPAADDLSPWMVVQVSVDDRRTDLRVRVRHPSSPTTNRVSP
ncbi:MAG: hypothetical protein K0V04_01730 [Deltaproteobacteria bacterium]|nr:hypothetical protein [Deltaproteobacteria bacterium]